MRESFDLKISTVFFLGLCFAMIAILCGFVLGGVFGAAEEVLKKNLDRSGTAVLESVYKSDTSAKDAVVKKSWEYFKRAHLHWGSVGSTSLALMLTLILVCRITLVTQMAALSLGLGSCLYPLFWLLAGIYAPQMGGTGIAKEFFSWVGIPGAALCVLGVLGTLLCVIRNRFVTSE